MKSNNPFLPSNQPASAATKPLPLISDAIVKEFPFKTLNRILNDLKWTVPYKEYLGSSSETSGPSSLLNSKPLDYLKNLAHLSKTFPRSKYDCLILNNSYTYAPNVEMTDLDVDGRQLTRIRGLLTGSSPSSSSSSIYHFQISILEIKPPVTNNAPVNVPVDKREYHIMPKALIPRKALDMMMGIKDQGHAHDDLEIDCVDEAYFKSTSSPNDHMLKITIFHNEFSNADLTPLTNQNIISKRYLDAISKYPQANLSPETVPNAIHCFQTLLKVLRGPLLLAPGDQTKTINIKNPNLNSQIDIDFLFNKLSFTVKDEELTPPNLVSNPLLRESYIRKVFEMLYVARQSQITPNEFATLTSFSNNLSIIYRTFNEVNQHLCTTFGNNEIDNSYSFLIELSVCSFFQDEMIIKCFENTWKSDKLNKLFYIDALKELVRYRTLQLNIRTSKLNTYFNNNKLIGVTDYLDALRIIGVEADINEVNKVEDDFIIAMYLATFKNDPKNYIYFNKKLRLIGEIRSSDTIANYLINEILPMSIALEELSIEEVTEDEVVITAYEFKMEDLLTVNNNNSQTDEVKFLNKAFLSVAVNRKSYLLMNYIDEKLPELIDTPGQATPTMEECFKELNCSSSSNSFEIILAFQKRLVDPNSDIRDLRRYLRTIIENTKTSAKILESFISTGTIDVSLLPAENWPAGLDNIGNTCYLNSLLQYYFCLKPLRDMVLEFKGERIEDGDTDELLGRKIGGRVVEKSEIIRSNQFIFHLQRLFNDMIHSERRCVQPRKELAFLAFSPASQPVTFMQELGTEVIEIIDDENDDGDEVTIGSKVIEDSENRDSPIVVSSGPSTPDGEDEMELDTGSIEIIEPQEKKSRCEPIVDLDDVEMEVIDPSLDAVAGEKILAISSDIMDSTIEMGRQQDVTECIENVTFQIETALKPDRLESDGEQYDLIKKLFYGKTKQTISPLNPNSSNKQRTLIERFSSLIINVSDHPKDIYDSLDNYFSEDLVKLDEGEVKRSLTISELPEILQFHVQRVLFDRVRLMPYKSLEPIPFSEKIYVDRYLDTEDPEILRRRNEVFKWKKEISELLEKKEFLTAREEGSQMTIIDTLVTAKRYFESLLIEDEEAVSRATIDAVEREIVKLTQEVKDIDSKIIQLRDLVSNQFKDYTQVGYSIFAIFIHRGEASYGHYWIYIKDPKRNIFRKYNDETVTEVPFSEVMNFEEGNTATPYYIVYAKELLEDEYIEPLKREIEHK